MCIICLIARTEFRRLIYSPLSWCLLAIVQFILSWIFLLGINDYLTQIQPLLAGRENVPGISELVISSLYLWAGLLSLAMMPLVTMRLLAEERMNQTWAFLSTAPISIRQIVLGKYLGVLLFILLLVLMISLMPLSLAAGTALDWGRLVLAMIGLFLLLASFAAAGLFLSSLAQQPVTAAAATLGLLVFLMILYVSGNSAGAQSDLFIYLSHFGHYLSFLQGVLDSRDVLYFLLFISAFLVLTIQRLENERV